ncbi:MAG: VCBS repeat-containing protein, partial [Bacteroidetes bacterium]|nr:VCBS repeat-containing protein [Bacteroidota bacterium]
RISMKALFLFILFTLPLIGQINPFSDQSLRLGLSPTYYGGHGVSIIDYNRDGWDDIFISNMSQFFQSDTSYCTLLKNNQNGTFTNVTVSAGLRIYGSFKSGIFGDINNDGYPDLFLGEALGNGRCHLLLNNKDGTFKDLGNECGIIFTSMVATAAFGDYDNDGRLDLFLATEYPDFDILYRNTSSGDTISFTDVSSFAGIEGFTSTAAMQSTFIDIDHDGDQDIYAVHDGFLPSSLFRNNGNGSFTDISIASGLYDYGIGNSMGLYWKDFDCDGWEEVYVTRIGKGGLYKRQPNGKYTNIADSSGAEFNGMTWGIVWEDLDNDMDDDMFLVNTYGYNGTKSIYYENKNGKYTDMASAYGLNFPHAFYGLAYGDFNNDGYLDLVAAATDGFNKLLLNTRNKSGNWIKLSLEGTSVNRMAVGVTVRAVTGSKIQRRTVTAGNSYASQMAPWLHFGLDTLTQIDTLQIIWSTTKTQTFTNVTANKHYRLLEGNTLLTPVSEHRIPFVPRSSALEQNYPNPFNPSTTISYAVGTEGLSSGIHVSLKVFDLLGKEIATIVDEYQKQGNYSVQFNSGGLPSGLYLYRLNAGSYTAVKKMILMK